MPEGFGIGAVKKRYRQDIMSPRVADMGFGNFTPAGIVVCEYRGRSGVQPGETALDIRPFMVE